MAQTCNDNETTRFQDAIRIQCCYRRFKAQRYLERLVFKVYEKCYDETYQTFYYHNKKTGHSSWLKPTLLGEKQDIKVSQYVRDHYGSNAFSFTELDFYKKQFQSMSDNDDLLTQVNVYEIFVSVFGAIPHEHVHQLIEKVAPHLTNEWNGIDFETYLRILQAQKAYTPHAISLYHTATFRSDSISSLHSQFQQIDPNYVANWYRSLPQSIKSGYPTISIANQHTAIDFNGFLYLLETILQQNQYPTQAQFSVIEILELSSQYKSPIAVTNSTQAQSESASNSLKETAENISLSQFISLEQLYSRFQHKSGNGIQLRTIYPGDATHSPSIGQYVCVHYSCVYAKEIIESTHSRGKPLEFRIGAGHLIVGFDHGIRMMSLGETSLLTLDPEVAYGNEGSS
uniref:peptidylprolyl isomerase n=1 Tax=Albugo laibachii Nc14 TaxID=890382 RepID=F0W6C9_9STRA|nr:conserved hypothetical protein [Albugo laibachii Nc14]|eukprot:CCA16673.1 conserved hypothetical protein [Albugo laibachii Nc14]